MASNLTRADRNLLTSGKKFRIGNKPYENGMFGDNDRDFIYFQLSSTDGSVIESRNLTFDRIQIDDEGKLLIQPVTDLNESGIDTGTYAVTYRFFRRLAGDETKNLLVKTTPNDKGNFDV